MTTVLTGGVFDLLHPGHLRLLERAACLGDRLVVAVQEDDAVCAVAGKQRPVMSTVERVEMVGALRCVDAVLTYRSGTDGQIVREVAPDVLVHGHDWHRQADRSRVLEALAEVGGGLVLLPRTEGISTSELRERVIFSATRHL